MTHFLNHALALRKFARKKIDDLAFGCHVEAPASHGFLRPKAIAIAS